MTKTMLLAGLMMVAACGGNTEPVAAETGQPLQVEQREAKHMEMKKRLDTNGDGKIQISELPEKMKGKMEKVDLDKDGVISEDEMKEAHSKMRAHMEEKAQARFASKDANKDGFLTADEVDAKHWDRMRVADTNGDGKLSLDELKAARMKFHGHHHKGMKDPQPQN
jgi:hypothetical protein